MPDPTTSRTIRMMRGGDHTLNGYVFTDLDHARQWLSQSFVDRAKTEIEEVEVGLWGGCPHCGGAGWTRPTKVIGKLTVDEFLEGGGSGRR